MTQPGRLSPPPRTVPLSLRCELLSGRWVYIGGLFFSTGLVVSSLFTWNWTSEWQLSRSRLRTAPGRLLSIERTGTSEGEEGTERQIRRYRYCFALSDGRTFGGSSYLTAGRFLEPAASFLRDKPGEVVIEYIEGRPEISRIRGMRASPFTSAWPVMVFPMIGLLMLIGGLWRGLCRIRLLREGELAWGTLKTITPPHDSQAPRPDPVPAEQFKHEWLGEVSDVTCTLTFQSADGQSVEAEDSLTLHRELLEAPQLRVLYDPDRLEQAFLLGGQRLPVSVSPAGDWDVPHTLWPILRLQLILLCVLLAPFAAWAAGRAVHGD